MAPRADDSTHSPASRPGEIRVGTSGWSYDHWAGAFYPADLRAHARLAFYAGRFDTVELNASFYRLPTAAAVRQWVDATPAGFLFACKASRYITHMKKLSDPSRATSRFFDMTRQFGRRLGPILFQLPPAWHVDLGRLSVFLDALPRNCRVAFEFRDETWFTAATYDLLARHDAACCAYDLDRRRSPIEVTADFVYVRLHGPGGPYRGTYDEGTLSWWATRFLRWQREGLDVYCYFDNDEAGYAARDASRLRGLLGAAVNFRCGPA